MADYEKLALKYSLLKVEAAIDQLRLDPAQQFFPTPTDVARVIEDRAELTRVPGITETRRYLNDWESHVRRCTEERSAEVAKAAN